MREDTHYLGHVEDAMEYFDGELSPDRARVVAAHLQDCEQCRHTIEDLRNLSAEMNTWQLELPELPMSSTLEEALQQQVSAQAQPQTVWSRWRKRTRSRRIGWVLGFGSATAAIAVLLFAVLWEPHSSKVAAPSSSHPSDAMTRAEREAASNGRPVFYERVRPPVGADRDRLAAPLPPQPGNATAALSFVEPTPSADQANAGVPRSPMIVRTAALTLVATDFDSARAALDDIVKRHQGYIGQISTTAPEQGERELEARLRIPAAQLDPALTELKKLGRLEQESQNGEEVTSEFVDLEARLANARNTEQRLTDLLRNRTGKLNDVLEVEQKISETREYIERMQAQRKSLLTSVDFASVNITIKQERKAQLQVSPPSIGTRFRNAAVDGYTMLADGVIGFLEVLLSVGPSLLLWGAVVFFPARWAWRRRHRAAS